MEHGYTAYTKGCRCDVCRIAKRHRMRSDRAAAKARLEASGTQVATGVSHGKSTYENHSCRCDKCCQAKRDYDTKRRRRGVA